MGIRPLVSHPISGLSCNLRRYRVPRALGCLVVPHLFVLATISESLQTSSLQRATRNSSNCSIARPDPIIHPIGHVRSSSCAPLALLRRLQQSLVFAETAYPQSQGEKKQGERIFCFVAFRHILRQGRQMVQRGVARYPFSDPPMQDLRRGLPADDNVENASLE